MWISLRGYTKAYLSCRLKIRSPFFEEFHRKADFVYFACPAGFKSAADRGGVIRRSNSLQSAGSLCAYAVNTLFEDLFKRCGLSRRSNQHLKKIINGNGAPDDMIFIIMSQSLAITASPTLGMYLLLIHPYITAVDQVSARFEGAMLTVSFRMHTIYGEVAIHDAALSI